ncbi:MAG: WYL domain-containing protein [Actinobacteria bacterium]|nr:WYL domain-containing protein [Actinomycetota bacterium]
MDKLERLLTLTATLLTTNRPLTAEELRDRIGGYPDSRASFRRAFERDKDDLREMGIPLETEEIFGVDPPAVGYRIRRDEYYLRDPGFEPDELTALRLAASLVRLDLSRGEEGLWKLGGVDDNTTHDGEALADLPSDPRLAPIFRAIADRAPVTFSYGDVGRTVDPYRLEFQRGRWYLTGFDHGRDDERNFRVDRIDGSVVVGSAGSFDLPRTNVAGSPAQPWQFGDGEPMTATVFVDQQQAPWAIQHLGESAVIERRDDGGVVVRLEVTNVAAFRSFVLTFLDHAEVLDPPELRADMVRWLEALCQS